MVTGEEQKIVAVLVNDVVGWMRLSPGTTDPERMRAVMARLFELAPEGICP